MADVSVSVSVLPCNDGLCMMCKQMPSPEEILPCNTCTSPWHVSCLSVRPDTVAEALDWECPDCAPAADSEQAAVNSVGARGDGGGDDGLIAAIKALQADESLTEREKARKRQALMSKTALLPSDSDGADSEKKMNGGNDALLRSFCCTICMHLPERPVTTPCGHNFCLKCYDRYVAQGKRQCANCRQPIPSSLRINEVLVRAIRRANVDKRATAGDGQRPVAHYLHNQDRPDKAFRSERAKKAGNANASSGRIFVTTAKDHFGPVTAEYDPERNEGVLVGRTWQYRMECRQWGIHRSVVAGISGQSRHGAQSVVLSGGYEDDEDHGEWFIYTGSGGKDLSGNKRTNKEHSKDQEFTHMNEALRLSCRMGYPVRVVRSHKEKRSSYAPREAVVRYDGIYRIEKCWRKKGTQGFKVCRYLFMRCDNEPAPWTSDVHGDRPRPLPFIKELNKATDITERKGSPSWDYDEEKECWLWKKPPPLSKQPVEDSGDAEEGKKVKVKRAYRQRRNMEEEIQREFGCHICNKVLTSPVTTPCAHNFCKACLEGAFAGLTYIKERTCHGRRTLRPQKNVMNCPLCSTDIAEFLQNLKVNTDLMNAIEDMQQKLEDLEEEEEAEKVEDQEQEEIDNDGKETVDEAKESISPAPQTETTPQEACEQKKPTRKRKKSNNAENAVDAGVTARRSKKSKMAVAV
ncbi:E3 ubiquitin-protein ligase ORTHRUS 2-like [Rosa sericea]